MKTVMAIEPVQEMADRVARNPPGGPVRGATGRGALIAETASGQDPQCVMNEEANLKEQRELALGAGLDWIVLVRKPMAAIRGPIAARRYASAPGAVSAMGERPARGDPTNPSVIEDPEEIARADDAVRDLGELCNRIPQPDHAG